MQPGESYSLSTSEARKCLSQIVTCVQDPRSTVVLTRHGKPVGAVVSMTELQRIWRQEDIDEIVREGKRPITWTYGKRGAATNAEAAEQILQLQLDRKMEREVLAHAGKAPIPGGEIAGEMTVAEPVRRRRWWQVWRR